METENKVYESQDFYLSCFLKAQGVKLVGAVKRGGIVTFKFEDLQKDGLEKLIIGFHSGDATVSVSEFCDSIKSLKGLKYNIRNTI